MKVHSRKQMDTLLFMALILLVLFGIGSVSEAYKTAIIVLTIFASAVVGWLITWIFKMLMESTTSVREDMNGKPRIEGKYTRFDFQLIYSSLSYLITATVAALINNLYNKGIEAWAENYSNSNASIWVGSVAIIGGVILVLYFLGVLEIKGKDRQQKTSVQRKL